MSQGVIHSLGVGRFLGWGAVNARGQLEGCGFWDKRVLELVGLEVGISQSRVSSRTAGWVYVVLYRGLRPTLKRYRELFGKSRCHSRLWYDPWCIGGDFNVIRFPNEHSREGRLSSSMRRSRLDRFLISEEWENHLVGCLSAHSQGLCLTTSNSVRWGWGEERSNSFLFENMWLKEEGFKELLKAGSKVLITVGLIALSSQKTKGFKREAESSKRAGVRGLERRPGRTLKSGQLWRKSRGGRNQRETWGVVRAYQEPLSDPGGWHPSMSSMEFDGIESEEAARLEEMFSMEEFPKKGRTDDLRDYRPISLVGGLYKILAKVLANSDAKNGFWGEMSCWIRWCISTASFSVLINGSPAGFFQSTRGLRQGDPISLTCFVLGMETLSCLINRVVRGGFLTGCRLRSKGGSGIQVSHLLFVDDTLVFCEDSQDQMAILSWLLMWFEAISGLSINLNKSEILPVGRVEIAEVLASKLGCKVGSLPSTYLGLPLGAPHKSDFLWGGGALEKRPHLVKWDVCFAAEKEFFWKLIISRKYREEGGGWISREVREGYGVGFWKEIRKEGILMFKNVSFTVGDDAWVADCWDSMGDAGEWYPCFSKPFNDWEMEAMVSLLSFLQGKRLFVGMEDRVPISLENHLEPLCAYKGGFFFASEASWGKVLTQDQLKRRGWILANSVNWVLPLTVRDTLLGWSASFVDKKRGKDLAGSSSLFILDGLKRKK
ncbi:hypothetical protein CK203_112342 [Vitis vinifera]|uniref:Reverse transcriptase domain-containing protein n=1 Tax=Vitis vinifera TaxID=29760 RepID=A0A438D0W9_VITVI|nr:hypothetical protein CK203_112342 [Vitis vinifera]